MPPYWLKVYDIDKYLNENKYDYVMYIDIDAIFYDFDSSIESVINELETKSGKTFDCYIGSDGMNSISNEAIINTGIFLFKNTSFSKEFVKIWLSSCIDNNKLTNQCKRWSFTDGKWSCSNCRYGMLNYEQGIMSYLYRMYKDNIAVLHSSFLSNSKTSSTAYTLHLMGAYNKSNILSIFKNFYDKIKKQV
jgi:hypothetical protein